MLGANMSAAKTDIYGEKSVERGVRKPSIQADYQLGVLGMTFNLAESPPVEDR